MLCMTLTTNIHDSPMKHLSRLTPVLLGLAACQSNSNPSATAATAAPAPPPPAAVQTAPAQTPPANGEHVDGATFRVVGLPDKQLTTKELTRQLGRPDSIAKGVVECGSQLEGIPMDSPDGDFWYYGRTVYEVSGNQAVLFSFDVTTGRFQGRIGKLVLDKNTTLEDVRRFFPVSAKDADQPAGHGRPGEVMSLPFYYKGVPQDGALELLFQNGRLQAVEFFSAC